MADSLSRTFARWGANLKYEDLRPSGRQGQGAHPAHAHERRHRRRPRREDAVEHTLHEESRPDGARSSSMPTRDPHRATFANAEMMHSSSLIDSYGC